MHLLWAPYAPKDTAAAPERPANLTNGEPWITKLLKLKKIKTNTKKILKSLVSLKIYLGISAGRINGSEMTSLVVKLGMVWRSFGYSKMI